MARQFAEYFSRASRDALELRIAGVAERDCGGGLRYRIDCGGGQARGGGENRAVPRGDYAAGFCVDGNEGSGAAFAGGRSSESLIESIDGSTAKVELEQVPAAQAALVAIDNATGEVKAMVGGYNFQDSKFN